MDRGIRRPQAKESVWIEKEDVQGAQARKGETREGEGDAREDAGYGQEDQRLEKRESLFDAVSHSVLISFQSQAEAKSHNKPALPF